LPLDRAGARTSRAKRAVGADGAPPRQELRRNRRPALELRRSGRSAVAAGCETPDTHGTVIAPPLAWTLASAQAIPDDPGGRCSVSHTDEADDAYRAYREALRRRVCAICLDGKDDGSCGLAASVRCALDQHLPRIVEAVLDVRERRDDAYAAAIEARVCGQCPDRDGFGLCQLRRDGRCALAVYLPLIVEAIEEVETRRDSGRA
jgi:hypothetical protein